MSEPPIGVLLMAYGGPESLADLPGYLADIRSGRTTPRSVLEEISSNYEAIGGQSPLLAMTRKQKAAIEDCLDPGQFRLYLGMRHWAPWIEETVGQMIEDGVTRAVSIVLAPHFSGLSVAKYQRKISDGLEFYRGNIEFAHVDSYYDAPGLIDAFARRVKDGLAKWSELERADVHVVFSAHSLPARIATLNDPYDFQTHETARLVAERVGLAASAWSWSYQSAGRSPEPWLGPTLQEHLTSLATRGIRNVVIVPIGFVSDHVEILFDIDIDAQRIASTLDMRLERPAALNDDPVFTSALARVIVDRAALAGWA